MPGLTEGNSPVYISPHSADVVLSDIRPIKLQVDALRSINALLDEFLFNILRASSSLSTDKLRASLLSLLPTSLGKEALLEAEVELRAYWERTGPAGAALSPNEDDVKTFHLQWAFELLRLKCEAYSTLNDSDEDSAAEGRLNEIFGKLSPHPPKATLVAPAALYLTAIIEAMCEHVLTNVGRVAARDSSRTNATVDDLFIALCEDEAIYGLFKTMKVYEQIEQSTKVEVNKSRRSKSFSRSDRRSESRTASPSQDFIRSNTTTSGSRLSSEGSSVTMAQASNSTSRSSLEKNRAMKMFISNTKGSNDTDSQISHKKSESLISESSRVAPFDELYEDTAMLQEFDNLMRSTSTMKVSLTPERLKTMEVFKQEKDQRGNRRHVPPLKADPDPSQISSPAPRSSAPRPSLRNVDSIVEDDEEAGSTKSPKMNRNRQASVTTPPSASLSTNVTTRIRSISTSSSQRNVVPRTPRSAVDPTPSAFTATSVSTSGLSGAMLQHRSPRIVKSPDAPLVTISNNNGFPPRTRKRQQNRESLDLDEVMAGSDNEQSADTPPIKPPSRPVSKKPGQHAVSASTRELMEFLAEGPPPEQYKAGKNITDYLAEGPPSYNASAISLEQKPKGSGRLQRMISKLSLGSSEKSNRGSTDGSSRARVPTTPIRPTIDTKPSTNTIPSLANRPIPPRPPRPISPPPSPSQDSFDDLSSLRQDNPRQSNAQESRSSRERQIRDTVPTSPMSVRKETTPNGLARIPPPQIIPTGSNGSGTLKEQVSSPPTPIPAKLESKSGSDSPRHTLQRKPVPPVSPTPTTPTGGLSEMEVGDLRRMMSKATTADECRLIFDMFLAKGGTQKKLNKLPDTSHIATVATSVNDTPKDSTLEHSLVELFLTGSDPVSNPNPHDYIVKHDNESTLVNSSPKNDLESTIVDSDIRITPDTTSKPITMQEHSIVLEVEA